MMRKALVPVLVAAVLAAGCQTAKEKWEGLGSKEKGAVAGTAGGAAAGAAIGGATGGSVLGGAALGGVAGGLAGYFFGDRVFKDDKAVAQSGTSGAAYSGDCQRANDYFRQANEATDLARKEELYKRGLELCPANAYAHNDLGTVYLREGKPDQARAEYRRALELKPDLEETRHNLDLLG